MTRSVRYQPIFNGLKFTLHRASVLNNVVITTVIEMVEMVEILGRDCNRSVKRVRYVINNLLHLVIVNSARDNTDATHEISRHISR